MKINLLNANFSFRCSRLKNTGPDRRTTPAWARNLPPCCRKTYIVAEHSARCPWTSITVASRRKFSQLLTPFPQYKPIAAMSGKRKTRHLAAVCSRTIVARRPTCLTHKNTPSFYVNVFLLTPLDDNHRRDFCIGMYRIQFFEIRMWPDIRQPIRPELQLDSVV